MRRRNVFRVAAAYVITGWLVVQIADLVLEIIEAPPWVLQALFLLLVIGFAFALIISWAYEMTPEGLKRERDVHRRDSITHVTAKKLDYVTVAAAIAVAGMFVWQQFLTPAAPGHSANVAPAGEEKTIAVLPFANMSADQDNEYFSDGVSEELLNNLVRVDGLQVASRTSAFSFKNKGVDIPTVASALRVNHVVDGSVRRAGNEVRISAQLIDVRTDRQLWSESYTRELKDVFAIQDEIAAAIASALKLTLLGDGPSRQPEKFEAYDLYLLGRHHFHLRTPESLPNAIELFEQSIAVDPQFALAYSGLADTYALIFQYGDYDVQVAFDKAHANALKAVELGPDLAEAHASLGLSLAIQGKLEPSRAHYRRAIELNPDYSMAHMWLGNTLFIRPREALVAFRAAERVDRLHPIIAENIGDVLRRLGRFDEGAEHLEMASLRDPDVAVLYATRSTLEFDRGDFAAAYRYARKAIAADPASSYALGAIVYAETDLGNFDLAEAWLERFKAIAPKHGTIGAATFSLLEARGDIEALAQLVAQTKESAPPTALPLWHMGDAVVRLQVDDPQGALQVLRDIEQGDVGDGNYLGVIIMRAAAQRMLEMNDVANDTAAAGLVLATQLRDNGLNLPWVSDNEAALLAILGRRDDAIAKLEAAFDQGLRNIYGFSFFWLHEMFLGDDNRYRAIHANIVADVQRQQAIIADEKRRCADKRFDCVLALIDDVP